MGFFPFRMFHNRNTQFFTIDKDLAGNEPETEHKELELWKVGAAILKACDINDSRAHAHTNPVVQKEGGILHPRLCWEQASLVCMWSGARLPFPYFKLCVPVVLGSKPVTASAKETQFRWKQECHRSTFQNVYGGSLQSETRCNCILFLLSCSSQVSTKLGISHKVLTLNLDGCLFERPAGWWIASWETADC